MAYTSAIPVSSQTFRLPSMGRSFAAIKRLKGGAAAEAIVLTAIPAAVDYAYGGLHTLPQKSFVGGITDLSESAVNGAYIAVVAPIFETTGKLAYTTGKYMPTWMTRPLDGSAPATRMEDDPAIKLAAWQPFPNAGRSGLGYALQAAGTYAGFVIAPDRKALMFLAAANGIHDGIQDGIETVKEYVQEKVADEKRQQAATHSAHKPAPSENIFQKVMNAPSTHPGQNQPTPGKPLGRHYPKTEMSGQELMAKEAPALQNKSFAPQQKSTIKSSLFRPGSNT